MPPLATLVELVDGLAALAERPALVVFGPSDRREWSYARLASIVRHLAEGLVADGLEPGSRVALFAPDGPEWIASALAILRAGAVVVPLDAQLADEPLAHVLGDSGARVVFTTADREPRVARLAPAARIVRLDAAERRASCHDLQSHVVSLPSRRPADPAALFYTSGTTGPPKGVPLSHENLVFQINTLVGVGLVAAGDRVCLPLPLHHVYPFVVGLLTPLALGLPLVIPPALTGPQIVRALKEGDATVLVGVPRLYGALLSAIDRELASRGRLVAAAFRLGLGLSTGAHRLGLPWGRRLFVGVRARPGPRLRLLTSGGAALEPEIVRKLEGLGWDVASGYGLTETSPLLALNLPGSGRPDSAGCAIPGIRLRIEPRSGSAQDEGEIQAQGPGVFAGYLNLPDKTREAFTRDGWFRTGDLGHLDAHGFLSITGRADEMLVTSGGENVNPEHVETAFLRHPLLRDFAVLQQDSRLVGLALPDVAAIERAGLTNVDQAVRDAVAEISAALPSYQRVTAVAVTREPLPRTRLGKLRRRALPDLYAAVQAGTGEGDRRGPIAVADMTEADRELLDHLPARRLWEWLSQRYPKQRLTMDVSLGLDLGVDSLEWLGLTLEIERRAAVDLDEAAIARVATVRDLLRAVAEAPVTTHGVSNAHWDEPERLLSPAQSRWLTPLGPTLTLLSRMLIAANGGLMRFLFRVRTAGLEHLPDEPWVMTPSHASLLDPLVLSAALGRRRLERTYWGGWTGVAFANPLMRGVSRLWRVLPVDQERGAGASLALAAAVLKRGDCLIWFPEGERSRTGELLPFRPGIGILLARFPRPVVPVSIRGTFEALPPGRWRIRPGPVTVTFGPALEPRRLVKPEMSQEDAARRIVHALQAAVADLARGPAPPAIRPVEGPDDQLRP
jgi:long-chain acyl-CoA synthetase